MRKVAALFLVVNNILVYQPTQTLPKGKGKGREFSLYYSNNIRDNEQRKNTFIGICRGSEGVLSLIYPILIPYASFGQVPMRFQ